MRKLDRYLAREMLGPLLFGVGAFAIVLVGVDILYKAFDLIMTQGLPAGAVALAMLYRMPQIIVFTFPMSVVFSTLMAFGTLSGNGEIVAMRAGGIGIPRLSVSALTLALLVALISFGLNGWVVAYANRASEQLLVSVRKEPGRQQQSLTLQIPDKGPPDRVLWARQLDPQTNTLYTLLIWEFRAGQPYMFVSADSASWLGDTWELRGVQLVEETSAGRFLQTLDNMRYTLGKSPGELESASRKPKDMTLAELRRVLALEGVKEQELGRQAREEINMRFAVPWAALGLALVGLPLGLRPQRTSTGVGLGISLAIIMAYYVLFSVMRIFGQSGALPPAVSDWIPHLLLFTIGLGLLINASR